jgi:dephospho-CoA kinase
LDLGPGRVTGARHVDLVAGRDDGGELPAVPLIAPEESPRSVLAKHFVVGLTGGIGSGKSSVAQLFAERGVEVIDADAIAHELTRPGGAAIDAIRAMFGDDVIDPRGALDRARMRSRAFAEPEARKRLETILHPMIRAETERRALAARSPYLILMIPLLVESGDPHRRCDRVLVVDCPEEEQIKRVMARSALSRADVEAIMAVQASRTARLRHADDIIENGGDPSRLPPQVDAVHQRYLVAAGAH